MKTLRYQIKALKELRSGAYTASLYLDGKKVADLQDDGRGGSPLVYWGGEWRPLEDAFLAWWRAEVPEWHWSYRAREDDYAIEWALSYVLDIARWNRLAKRGTVLVYRKPGCSDIEHFEAEEIYTQKVEAGHVSEAVAAARADGLQVWEYGEQRWVA